MQMTHGSDLAGSVLEDDRIQERINVSVRVGGLDGDVFVDFVLAWCTLEEENSVRFLFVFPTLCSGVSDPRSEDKSCQKQHQIYKETPNTLHGFK